MTLHICPALSNQYRLRHQVAGMLQKGTLDLIGLENIVPEFFLVGQKWFSI
jgi:hypothetical protein